MIESGKQVFFGDDEKCSWSSQQTFPGSQPRAFKVSPLDEFRQASLHRDVKDARCI